MAEDGAQRLAGRHAGLKAAVLAAEVKGKAAYRVVVGPVAPSESEAVEDRLEAAGIRDAWTLRTKTSASPRPPYPMLASLDR
ncbi:MAG: hypothetical protein H7841_11610 [Magnetospirillum sp. WYHS-4]